MPNLDMPVTVRSLFALLSMSDTQHPLGAAWYGRQRDGRCAVSWGELRAGSALVEQVDVGGLEPAAVESSGNRPIYGFRQLDRGDQIVVGDIDGGIHQPTLNRRVRQQFRLVLPSNQPI
jgi:hypothetical protein